MKKVSSQQCVNEHLVRQVNGAIVNVGGSTSMDNATRMSAEIFRLNNEQQQALN